MMFATIVMVSTFHVERRVHVDHGDCCGPIREAKTMKMEDKKNNDIIRGVLQGSLMKWTLHMRRLTTGVEPEWFYESTRIQFIEIVS